LLEEVAVARMGDPEDIQRLVTRIVENTEPSPIGIVSGRVNAVRTIQAPVLGPNGEAVLMVALARLPQPLSKRTASGFGRELLAACERISSALAA
jgi:DNA-binding IclR family transcriptional regulator